MNCAASAWQRFTHHRPALFGGALVLGLLLACLLSLRWSPEAMRRQKLAEARQPPCWRYPLGTDDLGRSLLWRMLYGGAVSLSLGLLSATVALVIGTSYGAVAGYVGGRCDEVMMRLVDILYALPYLLLVMLFTVSIGAWLENWRPIGRETARVVVLTLAIGGVSWLTLARVVRGQVLSLREQPFIEAARALGLPTRLILWLSLIHI